LVEGVRVAVGDGEDPVVQVCRPPGCVGDVHPLPVQGAVGAVAAAGESDCARLM
jgi:hypothetical protein